MKADSRDSGPVGEGSMFAFREFEEGHLGYSSKSQSLEKSVLVTGEVARGKEQLKSAWHSAKVPLVVAHYGTWW